MNDLERAIKDLQDERWIPQTLLVSTMDERLRPQGVPYFEEIGPDEIRRIIVDRLTPVCGR
jgi:hypothetical protein